MKQLRKRITAVMLSLAMVLAFMPVLGGVSYASDQVKSIKVSVLTQKDENTLLQAFPELTVRADAAESYGFAKPDTVRDPDESAQYPLANEVTTLDVLVEASHQIYGDAFTPETAGDYLAVNSAGTMTKIFGETTTLAGFTVNGVNPTYSDETTGSLIDDSIVEEGDSLRFFRTFEDDLDCGGLFTSMLYFENKDQAAYEALQGESLCVSVSAAYAFDKMMGGGGPLDPDDAVVAMKNEQGETVDTATADEDGDAVFTDLQLGNYTLVISAYNGNDWDSHFVTPYATVTVTEPKEVTGTVKAAVRNYEAADQFDIVPQRIRVSSMAAESYGDMGDRAAGCGDKITVADVLYTLHAQKYGNAFTKASAKDYLAIGPGGWITKCFGVETSDQVYIINNKLSMSGSTHDTILKDGDRYDHFMYRDGWNDVATCFGEDDITVNMGETFKLNLKRLNWDGTTEALKSAEKEEIIAVKMDSSGKLTPISGAKMDSNGAVSLTLNDTGTYEISATGKAVGEYGDGKIAAPHCTVTVVDPLAQVKSVKTVTINVKKVTPKAVDNAVAKAGGSSQFVTTFVIGKKVKKISKGAFKKYGSVTTLEVKSKKLKKKSVKGSLKGSAVTTVKVKVGSKKVNKKYVKKYKKIFTKKNAGKKAKVTR
ncbi:MAG: carboxypeptidase regulatory-like domain-containing protein [Firmicutes bacterium]|nr:carboxypeptidase regulatory-like domain-containing protein [Bacillota bacterium]